MKEAIGKIISRPYAGSSFHRPAVQSTTEPGTGSPIRLDDLGL